MLDSDDDFADIEADLRFVLLVLSGIEGATARLRWVRQNLPRTAQLIGADSDLVPGSGG